jgi:hypothetical protein
LSSTFFLRGSNRTLIISRRNGDNSRPIKANCFGTFLRRHKYDFVTAFTFGHASREEKKTHTTLFLAQSNIGLICCIAANDAYPNFVQIDALRS